MAGTGEAPVLINYLQYNDLFTRIEKETAVERRPLRLNEVWVQLDGIPEVPPPPGPPVGNVQRVTGVVLEQQTPSDAYRYAPTAGELANMVPGVYSDGAYAPTLVDAKGVTVPYDPNVWVADGVLGVVAFKYKTPAQLGLRPPFTFAYWRYVGAFPATAAGSTFPSITLTNDAAQITMGTANPVVLSTNNPGAPYTANFPAPGVADTNLVLSDGAQTLNGPYTLTQTLVAAEVDATEVKSSGPVSGTSLTATGAISGASLSVAGTAAAGTVATSLVTASANPLVLSVGGVPLTLRGGIATTTIGTPTATLLTFPTTAGRTYTVQYSVAAGTAPNSIAATGTVRCKNIGGVLTLGSAVAWLDGAEIPGAAVTPAVSGTDLLLTVTGAGGTTLWAGSAQVVERAL